MAQTTLTTNETLEFPMEGTSQAAEPLLPVAQANEKKCEFCLCTTTPMWRRGPKGKSTLCNACGVKWSIRTRNERQEMPIQKPTPPPPAEPKVKLRRGRKPKVQKTEARNDVYYCRYCHTTWPITAFKNRQQFGAHCSNCSRKRKSRDLPAPVSVDRSITRPAKRQKVTWASKAYLEDQAAVETETPEENTALFKLLDAVEAVLEEEHELETLRSKLMNMRQTLNEVGTKRESELAGLREWLFAEFDCLRKGITVQQRPFSKHETMGLRGFNASPSKSTKMEAAPFALSSTRGNTSPVGTGGPTAMEIDAGAGSGLMNASVGPQSNVNTPHRFESPSPRVNTKMNGNAPVQNQPNPNGVHNGATTVNMGNNIIMRQGGNVYLKSTLDQVVSLRVTEDQIDKVKKHVLDQFNDVQASVYKKLDDLKATIGKNLENQDGQNAEQQRKALADVDKMLVESREEIQSKFVSMTRDMQTTIDESRSEISNALQAYQKNFETALQNEDRALNCKLDNLRTKTQQKLVEVSVSLASVGTLLHPVII